MTFEEKLAQAFKETFEERSEQLMKIEKKHRFSLAYRLWERKTLRDFRRNRLDKGWTLRKARYAVTSAIIAASLLIGGTVYAAIAAVGRYSFEDKVDYSKVIIEKHPSDKTIIEEYYGLPEEEGWELVNYTIFNHSTMLNYQQGDVKICFNQNLIHDGTMSNISTDRAAIEPLSLYEENDGFLLDFGNNILLYWIYDGYLLSIDGNVDKNEAIKLAYSTKIVDLQKNS